MQEASDVVEVVFRAASAVIMRKFAPSRCTGKGVMAVCRVQATAYVTALAKTTMMTVMVMMMMIMIMIMMLVMGMITMAGIPSCVEIMLLPLSILMAAADASYQHDGIHEERFDDHDSNTAVLWGAASMFL